jgi:signal transduction histidine kinase
VTIAVLVAIPAHSRIQNVADKWLPRPRTGELPQTPGPISRSLRWRLAHILWLAFFTFLNWQLLQIFSSYPSIHSTMQADWSVQMSVKALPGVSLAGYAAYMILFRMGTAVLYWLAAVLIFWRKRDDWFALAISFLLLFLPFSLALDEITTGPLELLGQLSMLGMLLVPFFFPDGRLVPKTRRWRIVLVAFLLLVPVLTFTLVPALVPVNQDDIEWASMIISINAILLAGLSSMVVRYRQMTAGEQRQIRWVLTVGFGSLSVLFIYTIFWSLGYLERGGISEPVSALIALHLNNLSASAFPLAIGYSILRHRLWEVDVWVNRTLVFGGLTLLVAVVYILAVGLMSRLFQSGGSVVISVLATGLIAILFNPLRQRLQTAVNRFMYGERDDPVTVLTTPGKRLEETAVPAETLPVLVATIAQTLKLPYVALTAGDVTMAASGPPPIDRLKPLALPLVYHSETIGQLLVSPRAPDEDFNPAEMGLLQNVARQAGPAVYAAQLTADLQRSRERLVSAREEERRRIRRDLHDGLGPQLATLSLKADAARNYLANDPETTGQLLTELKSEIQSAIADIRRLVHDLRPPALDQLGLVSALREYAGSQNGRSPLDMTIQAPEKLPPLPAAVEVAAYRIALEAMTNAMRHSRGRCCTVLLLVNDGLRLEIRDDGAGLPAAYQAGVGLSSMRERTAELGGTFEIHSAEGGGTAVIVWLPIS